VNNPHVVKSHEKVVQFFVLDQRGPTSFKLRGHFTKTWQFEGHFQ